MANEPWVIAPCGGVRLSKDSFEITYDEEDNKPLVEVKGSHKFTYKVKFEKEGIRLYPTILMMRLWRHINLETKSLENMMT